MTAPHSYGHCQSLWLLRTATDIVSPCDCSAQQLKPQLRGTLVVRREDTALTLLLFWRRSTASSVFWIGTRGRAFALLPSTPTLPPPPPPHPTEKQFPIQTRWLKHMWMNAWGDSPQSSAVYCLSAQDSRMNRSCRLDIRDGKECDGSALHVSRCGLPFTPASQGNSHFSLANPTHTTS